MLPFLGAVELLKLYFETPTSLIARHAIFSSVVPICIILNLNP